MELVLSALILLVLHGRLINAQEESYTIEDPEYRVGGCEAPNIRNGYTSTKLLLGQRTFSVGDRVYINCNEGYKKSRTYLICRSDGSWGGADGVCKVPTTPGCRVPDFPMGSGFYSPEPTGNKYAVGTKLTFRCNNGFVMLGSQYSYCESSGEWNSVPVCIDGCNEQAVKNGSTLPALLKGQKYYKFGETVTLKCDTGYRVVGPSTATCTAYGTWSALLLCADVCDAPKKLHLTALPAPIEGKNLYKIGNVVTFRCDKGYRLSGAKKATCQSGNKWSVELPKCEKAITRCKPPKAMKVAVYEPIQIDYAVGDKIAWTCKSGFVLRAGKYSTCSNGGSFKPMRPVCKIAGKIDIKPGVYVLNRRACRRPRTPSGGLLRPYKTYYNLETDVEFVCKTGYYMSGTARATCRKQGFGNNIPVCHRVKCSDPRKPMNGDFLDTPKDAYYFGDQVRYICNTNHIMYGSDTAKCQADGQFSPGPPSCKPPSCRYECKYEKNRSCQCDAPCRIRQDCCKDFEQFCRKLFY